VRPDSVQEEAGFEPSVPRDTTKFSMPAHVTYAWFPARGESARIKLSQVAAVFVILVLTGCTQGPTTQGQPPPPSSQVNLPDPHRFSELVPGISTTTDAIARLGTPSSYSAMAQGQTLLQWIDMYSVHPIHVAILFGADARMIRVQHVFIQ
jgi:hypothetical protein